MTTEQKELVLFLSEKGNNSVEIAKLTNISAGTISSFLYRERNKRICPHCGKKFLPKRKNQLFCCSDHRKIYWNTHQELVNRKTIYHVKCLCCGKEFDTYDNRTKYCSKECYVKHRFRSK